MLFVVVCLPMAEVVVDAVTAVYTVCGFLYDGPCPDECAWTIKVSLM
jgi:hypothetical protein